MTDMNELIMLQIDLAITLRTPLCVGAAGSSGGLADKTLLRDGWNRPIIPGSQLKGRVRHTCERIAAGLDVPICTAPHAETMCPYAPNQAITRLAREPLDHVRAHGQRQQCIICAIFGSPIYLSPLAFHDLAFTPQAPEFPPPQPYVIVERLRPGVGIDRRRRTAQEEVLYLVETTDAGIQFKGTICGRWLNTPLTEVRGLAGLLLAGLQSSTRWGGGSSRGLGWADVATTAITLNDEPQTQDALIEEVPTLCPTE
jgi:CRISPR/Cas system CSM-associated protein Csm3 (group 7 of RAMP superfamily)